MSEYYLYQMQLPTCDMFIWWNVYAITKLGSLYLNVFLVVMKCRNRQIYEEGGIEHLKAQVFLKKRSEDARGTDYCINPLGNAAITMYCSSSI